MKQLHAGEPGAARDWTDYATGRMLTANIRLLEANTPAQRIRAAQWVVAWAMAAGADAPRDVKLRTRNTWHGE